MSLIKSLSILILALGTISGLPADPAVVETTPENASAPTAPVAAQEGSANPAPVSSPVQETPGNPSAPKQSNPSAPGQGLAKIVHRTGPNGYTTETTYTGHLSSDQLAELTRDMQRRSNLLATEIRNNALSSIIPSMNAMNYNLNSALSNVALTTSTIPTSIYIPNNNFPFNSYQYPQYANSFTDYLTPSVQPPYNYNYPHNYNGNPVFYNTRPNQPYAPQYGYNYNPYSNNGYRRNFQYNYNPSPYHSNSYSRYGQWWN